jgi:hypothetical protein
MSYEQSAEVGELAKALASAQTKMGPAAFDAKNPHFNSRFASLASVREAAKPLADAGIAVMQWPVSREGGDLGVRTQITHISGQWTACTLWGRPERPGPQAIGSLITYLRRYSLAAAVGIAADEDDDAEGAEARPAPKAAAPKAAPAAPATPAGASPTQLKALVAALAGPCPGDPKAPDVQQAMLAYVAETLGRPVGKLRELSVDDVARVIGRAAEGAAA